MRGPRTIHRRFRDEVAEELGDILWYVANVASKFDLRLGDIAAQNLLCQRCGGRLKITAYLSHEISIHQAKSAGAQRTGAGGSD